MYAEVVPSASDVHAEARCPAATNQIRELLSAPWRRKGGRLPPVANRTMVEVDQLTAELVLRDAMQEGDGGASSSRPRTAATAHGAELPASDRQVLAAFLNPARRQIHPLGTSSSKVLSTSSFARPVLEKRGIKNMMVAPLPFSVQLPPPSEEAGNYPVASARAKTLPPLERKVSDERDEQPDIGETHYVEPEVLSDSAELAAALRPQKRVGTANRNAADAMVNGYIAGLSKGHNDWDPQLFVRAKSVALQNGLHSRVSDLHRCVRTGTEAAIRREHYWVRQNNGKSIKRVDICQPQSVEVDWFGRANVHIVADVVDSKTHFSPPFLFCDKNAVDVAAHCHEHQMGTQRPLVCVVEVSEFSKQGGFIVDRTPMMSPYCLLARTDFARFVEEAQNQLYSGNSSLEEHLRARRDPYIFLCRDVTVFRGSREQGYPFLATPFKLQIIVYALAEVRVPVQTRLTSEGRQEWYQQAQDHTSLLERLSLVALVSMQEFSGDRGEQEMPILIMPTPSSGGYFPHPRDAVASVLKQVRKRFAGYFHAVFFCYGSREVLGGKSACSQYVADIVNHMVHRCADRPELLAKASNWHWTRWQLALLAEPEKLEQVAAAVDRGRLMPAFSMQKQMSEKTRIKNKLKRHAHDHVHGEDTDFSDRTLSDGLSDESEEDEEEVEDENEGDQDEDEAGAFIPPTSNLQLHLHYLKTDQDSGLCAAKQSFSGPSKNLKPLARLDSMVKEPALLAASARQNEATAQLNSNVGENCETGYGMMAVRTMMSVKEKVVKVANSRKKTKSTNAPTTPSDTSTRATTGAFFSPDRGQPLSPANSRRSSAEAKKAIQRRTSDDHPSRRNSYGPAWKPQSKGTLNEQRRNSNALAPHELGLERKRSASKKQLEDKLNDGLDQMAHELETKRSMARGPQAPEEQKHAFRRRSLGAGRTKELLLSGMDGGGDDDEEEVTGVVVHLNKDNKLGDFSLNFA